jgi:pimeloyl-ACP methyl ester carboxylesterase
MSFKTRRPLTSMLALAVGFIALIASVVVSSTAGASSKHDNEPKPTIVLVHGAWADASSFNDVSNRLQKRGFTVVAPANPLRGLSSDSAYLSSILATISGPIVLVGHSYGGMVITDAATGNTNIKALVYIAAFAPDAGDSLGSLGAMNPGSELGPTTLLFRPYPTGLDVYIVPEAFREVFAADVEAHTAAVMAAGQRPLDASALGEPSGEPAWKTIPSWYMVADQDHAIPPATEQFMAQRAGATTVEVNSSHVAMISMPTAVTDLILDAVKATS